MGDIWRNWSGGLAFRPGRLELPASEDEVVALVRKADAGRTIRPLGSGHSSSPLVATDDVVVGGERLRGLRHADPDARRATLGAGTTIRDTGEALLQHGLAMENTGDIDRQQLAGGFATGTHGSGRRLRNLSSQLVGVRLVTGTGEAVSIDEDDPERLAAARVSLGALGIATEVTLRLLPAFRLRRIERCMPVDELLDGLDARFDAHRNLDFYWYPRRDDAKLRTLDEVGDDVPDGQRKDGTTEELVGWSGDILPRVRELRFHEMEYAVPFEHGPACFRAVRERIKERHRKEVAWRVLYRAVAADAAHLSPAHGRDTVTISLHHNATLPYMEFFTDVEPIFREHGGRPHWGKVHTLRGERLLERYPMADRFLKVRDELDPDGRFLSPYLGELLGLAAGP
jgi:FAD/FMN-containing dehydrogenase